MRISRWAAVIAVVTICVAAAALGTAGSGSAKPTAGTTVALVSDIGKFNDHGFNQNQLAGLNRAKAKLGVNDDPARSRTRRATTSRTSTRPMRKGAKLVIAAGFLLARRRGDATRRSSRTSHFAITDYTVHASPFADKKGKVLYNERRGPDLRGERVRLPRRRPRGEDGAEGRRRRRSARSAASRSRRSTSGSRATSSARRRPSRARRS